MAAKSHKTKKQAAVKKQKKTKKAVVKPLIERLYAPLPNVFQLSKQTSEILWAHRDILGGVTLVYGFLSLILVRGLGSGVNVAQLRDQLGNHVSGGLEAYFQLLGNNTNSADPNAGVYQIILFIVGTLAFVWALRQLLGGERPTVKDAYYRGMHPLVPFVLVLLVISLQFLPTVIGLALYQFLAVSGIITSIVGAVLVGLVVLGLMLLSLYLVASSIVALYIVTLPGMTPMLALKTAKTLVKGRRWTLLRKILFLPLALLIIMGIIMVPFILIAPIIAGWVLFILGILTVAIGHAYLYNLYQRLLDEQQTE